MMARFLPSICFILLILLLCMEAQAGRLPDDEVEALREIGRQLKKDWNFSLDPCINDTISSWTTPKMESRPLYGNSVFCNCSYPGGVCHVENITLKGQDLAGILPPALVKLPYLKIIDLNRNYLSGNIPHEWASMQLEFLVLSVNNLSGPIPGYLGNIATLQYLSLENNMFSGNVPPELGQLVNLENLTLSANNLTGKLPTALTHLEKLKELDLSFNRLEKQIPDFEIPNNLTNMYLTSNLFSGTIPRWIRIRNSKRTFDLSYNNLTKTFEDTCIGTTLNLFKSFHGLENSTLGACPEDDQCSEEYHSVYINCGGSRAAIGSISYEGDTDRGGPSKFYPRYN